MRVHIDFDACYRAASSRDPRFDGRFYTAVTSTGVYCLPSCPSRTPAARNVRFYRHPAAAEAAGFRACRRCRPETRPHATGDRATLVGRALALIDEGLLDGHPVEELARRLAVSERHLRRLFAAELGAGPLAVASSRRAHLARRLLDDTDLPLTRVAFAAGYASVRQFNAQMRATFGRPPSALRARPSAAARPRTVASGLRLRLALRPPLAVGPLLAFLAAHAVPGVVEVTERAYRRVVALGGQPAVLTLTPHHDHVSLHLDAVEAAAIGGVVAASRRLCDLDADPAASARTLDADPLLADLVAAHPGLRVPGAFDAFETAAVTVLGQQVGVAAARTLAGRLVLLAGTPLAEPVGTLTHRFPSPADVAAAPLTELGVPRSRAEALRALAAAVADGGLRLDPGVEPDRLEERLRALPGIGAWTASVIALRVLGDPDTLPAGDAALRRAAGGATPLTAAALRERSRAWRPWRSYAAQHLWTVAGSTPAPRRTRTHATRGASR